MTAHAKARLPLRPRALRPAALLAAAALGAGGCGGEGGGGEQALKVVDQTFSGKKQVRSARVDFNLAVNAKGSPQVAGKPLSLSITGPFQSRGRRKVPKFDLDLRASFGGQSFNAGAVSTGSRGYLKFQGTSYAVGEGLFGLLERAVAKAPKRVAGKEPSLAAFGVQPRKWLKEPKNEGEENVAGVPTTHISSGVDVPRMLDDFEKLIAKAGSLGLTGPAGQVPREIPPTVRKQIQDAVKEVKFDLWSGAADKILRQLEVFIRFEVPKDAGAPGGLEGGDLRLRLTLNELNKPQRVTAPASAKPLSELLGQLGPLGALLGGGKLPGALSGAGGAKPGAGGKPKSAPSGQIKSVQRYTACIQGAQGAAELEACAKLLK